MQNALKQLPLSLPPEGYLDTTRLHMLGCHQAYLIRW
jgi:hypothetical protein